MDIFVPRPWIFSSVLGDGSFSKVFRCIHHTTGETKAVKRVDKAAFSRFKKRYASTLRVADEVYVLNQLQRQGIVRLTDFFHCERYLYLVLDLVSDRDLLQHLIDEGPFSEKLSRRAFKQLLEVIRYVHEQGFMHRDIKPENVMPTSNFRSENMDVVLVDWGLACDVRIDGGRRTRCGSAHYLAPEVVQVTPACMYGQKADMWSLGVTLYVMLAGDTPFTDECLYEQISAGAYVFDGEVWSNISGAAHSMVRGLLLVNTLLRLSSSDALSHEWFAGTHVE
jgi:serine/threonine protein kinase